MFSSCLAEYHLSFRYKYTHINRLTPNDPYMGRTAPLTSKRCILYIYSTNIGTEYFKYALYSPFFSLQNAVRFIMLTGLVPVLFTFHTQGVLKLKKKSGSKRLIHCSRTFLIYLFLTIVDVSYGRFIAMRCRLICQRIFRTAGDR